MMTATKAVAGGVAANIVTIIVWAISTIPGWKTVPDEPKAAILGLISGAVGAAIVYYAPSNKQTVPSAPPATERQPASVMQPTPALAGATS